ncbi:MAG: hypothetical protein K6F05_01520 [Succinivibrio sp.]|nr:hypothetical protein [Succinivibrio sp.]
MTDFNVNHQNLTDSAAHVQSQLNTLNNADVQNTFKQFVDIVTASNLKGQIRICSDANGNVHVGKIKHHSFLRFISNLFRNNTKSQNVVARLALLDAVRNKVYSTYANDPAVRDEMLDKMNTLSAGWNLTDYDGTNAEKYVGHVKCQPLTRMEVAHFLFNMQMLSDQHTELSASKIENNYVKQPYYDAEMFSYMKSALQNGPASIGYISIMNYTAENHTTAYNNDLFKTWKNKDSYNQANIDDTKADFAATLERVLIKAGANREVVGNLMIQLKRSMGLGPMPANLSPMKKTEFLIRHCSPLTQAQVTGLLNHVGLLGNFRIADVVGQSDFTLELPISTFKPPFDVKKDLPMKTLELNSGFEGGKLLDIVGVAGKKTTLTPHEVSDFYLITMYKNAQQKPEHLKNPIEIRYSATNGTQSQMAVNIDPGKHAVLFREQFEKQILNLIHGNLIQEEEDPELDLQPQKNKDKKTLDEKLDAAVMAQYKDQDIYAKAPNAKYDLHQSRQFVINLLREMSKRYDPEKEMHFEESDETKELCLKILDTLGVSKQMSAALQDTPKQDILASTQFRDNVKTFDLLQLTASILENHNRVPRNNATTEVKYNGEKVLINQGLRSRDHELITGLWERMKHDNNELDENNNTDLDSSYIIDDDE